MKNKTIMLLTTALIASGGFAASEADKPMGFRFFNQHLTIKPYVSLSYTYDSNVYSTKKEEEDGIFTINPGADFTWTGDRWAIAGSVWYRHEFYADYNSELGDDSYGESLNFTYATADSNARGWSLMLRESYTYTSQSDSLQTGGRGVWRDQEQINVAGAVERRFTDRWHADATVQYDDQDYVNNDDKYAPLYGWHEWSVGLEGGFVLSPWTDLLVSGGYTRYSQSSSSYSKDYDSDSESYTVMGGIGTRATEKITYRLMAGASKLRYGGREVDSGWNYSASANWRMTRQVQLSLLGSSYYQPNERTLGSAVKVYTMSMGVSYLTLGDKVNLTANVAYHHDENVYTDVQRSTFDYDTDYLSWRLGASYTLNRWVSTFANFCYEQEWNGSHDDYEYDSYSITLGLRFHY